MTITISCWPSDRDRFHRLCINALKWSLLGWRCEPCAPGGECDSGRHIAWVYAALCHCHLCGYWCGLARWRVPIGSGSRYAPRQYINNPTDDTCAGGGSDGREYRLEITGIPQQTDPKWEHLERIKPSAKVRIASAATARDDGFRAVRDSCLAGHGAYQRRLR